MIKSMFTSPPASIPPAYRKLILRSSIIDSFLLTNKETDPTGYSIGYSRMSYVKRDSRIAIIPIGYADGLDRHFSNGGGEVLINGQRCPIIGNICMDACMIDVTDIHAQEGDAVIIFGDELPVSELSDKLKTIPYEILTSISPRVKRVYFRE